MSRKALLLFLALGVIWGVPYLLIRIAVADYHPIIVAFGRAAIGALVLLPFAMRGDGIMAGFRKPGWLILFTLAEISGPAILKTRRLGYDGRGQIRIASPSEAAGAFERLGAPGILEGFCAFDREVSIIAARSVDGEVAFYDLCENEHDGGILSHTRLPARRGHRGAHHRIRRR